MNGPQLTSGPQLTNGTVVGTYATRVPLVGIETGEQHRAQA